MLALQHRRPGKRLRPPLTSTCWWVLGVQGLAEIAWRWSNEKLNTATTSALESTSQPRSVPLVCVLPLGESFLATHHSPHPHPKHSQLSLSSRTLIWAPFLIDTAPPAPHQAGRSLGLPVTASQMEFSRLLHVSLSEVKGSVLGIKSALFSLLNESM